jgi:hypothetical protein
MLRGRIVDGYHGAYWVEIVELDLYRSSGNCFYHNNHEDKLRALPAETVQQSLNFCIARQVTSLMKPHEFYGMLEQKSPIN